MQCKLCWDRQESHGVTCPDHGAVECISPQGLRASLPKGFLPVAYEGMLWYFNPETGSLRRTEGLKDIVLQLPPKSVLVYPAPRKFSFTVITWGG